MPRTLTTGSSQCWVCSTEACLRSWKSRGGAGQWRPMLTPGQDGGASTSTDQIRSPFITMPCLIFNQLHWNIQGPASFWTLHFKEFWKMYRPMNPPLIQNSKHFGHLQKSPRARRCPSCTPGSRQPPTRCHQTMLGQWRWTFCTLCFVLDVMP